MKSQYTDSITGEVLADIRVIDNRVFSFSDQKIYKTNQNLLFSNLNIKFSKNSIMINNRIKKEIGFKFKIPKTLTKFTFCYWLCLNEYNLSSANYNNYISSGPTLDEVNNKSFNLGPLVSNNTSSLYIANSNPYTYYVQAPDKTESLTKNTWYYYTLTFDGNNCKAFKNGQLINSLSSSIPSFSIKHFSINCSTADNIILFIDDIVLIDQVLWTNNFTIPNYYLTGDKDIPKKLSKRQIIYDPLGDYNDYFDKAILY